MSLINAVTIYLRAQASLTAVLGTRIRSTQADEDDALPYIVFRVVSEPHQHHMGGASGLARPRIQIDCIGESPPESWDVSELVRTVLQGYRGAMDSVSIRRCHLSNRVGPEQFGPQGGSQKGKYRTRMDFMIDHHESIPSF